jgi:UDP-N-acetylglucosamine/UDP-N-acetylgalactosamine diphosphorylase
MQENQKERLKDLLAEYRQEHVLKYWDTLDENEKEALASQLEEIDHEEMNRLVRMILTEDDAEREQEVTRFEPAPVIPVPSTVEEKERYHRAFRTGEQLLARGKVAVFLVAGGQASRLGFPGPKGMFPVTPLRKKSLFELFAEKMLSLSGKYDVLIPWYIMTSNANHMETVEFFEEHAYFGLRRDGVKFFRQREIPAVSMTGKYLLESPSSIFMNPDGHGGSIHALFESGALHDMKQRAIDEIFYFQVDNPLVRIADPAFIGYHVMTKARMSTKVVRKTHPEERVGVVGLIDGRPGVIEYSDLSGEEMKARNDDGELKFNAGNIAIHMINRRYLEDLNRKGFTLPYHRAVKKMKTVDGEVGGVKFEMFIFDALGMAERTVVMEVERSEEFAPVKNSEGVDSPQSAHRMQIEMYASWLEDAGVEIPRTPEGEVDGVIEINPLYALTKDEFLYYYREKPLLKPGFTLYIE